MDKVKVKMVIEILLKQGKALRFNEENLKLVNKKRWTKQKNAEVISSRETNC